jgi:hypothetical protein
VADDLALAILAAGEASTNETELFVAVETALKPVLDLLEIPSTVEYERTFIEGRADEVYGWLIIEYERPGKLATKPGREEAFRQCRHYMRQRAEESSPGEPEAALPKMVGVALDGRQIGFVRWRRSKGVEEDLPDLARHRTQLTLEVEKGLLGGFEEFGPFPITTDSITDFLLYLRALSRRPLEARPLAEEFGPNGETAKADGSGSPHGAHVKYVAPHEDAAPGVVASLRGDLRRAFKGQDRRHEGAPSRLRTRWDAQDPILVSSLQLDQTCVEGRRERALIRRHIFPFLPQPRNEVLGGVLVLHTELNERNEPRQIVGRGEALRYEEVAHTGG